jgi:hypothetical protein
VTWNNKGSYTYYCPKCTELINERHRRFSGENYDLCVNEVKDKGIKD